MEGRLNPTRTGAGSLIQTNRGGSRISSVHLSQIPCITPPPRVSNRLYLPFSKQEQTPIPPAKSTEHVFKLQRTTVTLELSGLYLTQAPTRIMVVVYIMILS